MTNKEIVSQLITFLMAGLETVSTTVSCTAYLLALNPDVQQKAHEKIEAYFHSKPVRQFTAYRLYNYTSPGYPAIHNYGVCVCGFLSQEI